MNFSMAYLSEKGPRHENEDCVGAWTIGDGRVAIAIADGVGGNFGGDTASQFAVERFREEIHSGFSANLDDVVRKIHLQLKGQQERNEAVSEMATTFSAALFDGSKLRGVHVGDSRVSISRKDGILRLTKDHTEAQKFLDAGKITKEEAKNYIRRNVLTSALGIKGDLNIELFNFDLLPGDRVYFTTDGVHDKILLREMLEISNKNSSPEELVEAIENEMVLRGAADNYSFACCFISS